jgi:hypothetical protein
MKTMLGLTAAASLAASTFVCVAYGQTYTKMNLVSNFARDLSLSSYMAWTIPLRDRADAESGGSFQPRTRDICPRSRRARSSMDWQ